ncbi:hypothetical protein BWQ96_10680 [Gracilariopsis chorda]|uniref:Uncharacterized protein n=1 Tax=Gracilariopsis chorda TaxID=448386 RepID=A0A2V3IC00_9FLOR|nr:hypothetical protein BWQ96_10680 [Gracilariopsis chorda]|eukprot:PXF39624.1 hypothetical protein BWQ96_10680 [Gracilariopsis chorda]
MEGDAEGEQCDAISPAKTQDTASQDAVVEGDTEGQHCQDAAMEGDPEGEYCYNAAVEGDAEGEQCDAKVEHCQDVGAGGDIQGELCRESGVAIIDPPTAHRDDNSAVEECDQGPDPEPAGPEDRCDERGVGSDIQGDSCQQTGVAVVKIDQNRSVRGTTRKEALTVPGGASVNDAFSDLVNVEDGEYGQEDECHSEASTDIGEGSGEGIGNEISDIEVGEESVGTTVPVLDGTIPNILRWTIAHLKENPARKRINVAPAIVIGENVTFWLGGQRFWDNIVRFARMLSLWGSYENVLWAMELYPSSVLVNTGFRPLFEKNKKLGTKPIACLLPYPNAFSEFSASKVHSTARNWYKDDCFTRLQETAVHLTAIAEYVLRCAFISRKSSDVMKSFMDFLTTRITMIETGSNSQLVLRGSKGLLRDMPEEEADMCLRMAMKAAHNAVVRGLAVAGRKKGKKKQNLEARQKVDLLQIQSIPAQVSDILIANLELSLMEILGGKTECQILDSDEFEFRMKRVLRGVQYLYQTVGVKFFNAVYECIESPPRSNDK